MRTRQLTGALAALMVAAGAGAAEGPKPLSAIDWLSDSLELPLPEMPKAEETPGPVESPDVSVMPLGADVPDAAGLIPAARLGLPRDLWGRSAASDLADRLSTLRPGADTPPTLRRFLRNLSVVRLEPPIDAGTDDSLFLARADTLLALGRLADAKALLEQADPEEPRYFRRLFDIALLTGTEAASCRAIEEVPELSPTSPAHVFCLARNGEWEVAALTLGTAEALGMITPEEDALLVHFLDPELGGEATLLPPPRTPTPLQFRLYEAVGERIPTATLPVAFAVADLSDLVGWKTRLRAAERLTAAGAMLPRELIAIYSERAPAASGGVWQRVAAVQAFERAAKAGNDNEIERTLAEAWDAVQAAEMGSAMAPWFARRLKDVALAGAARHAGFEIALFADDVDLARKTANGDRFDRFLLGLAEGSPDAAPPPNRFGQSLVRGLTASGVPERHAGLTDDDRAGEALLQATSDLSHDASGNPERTADALQLLRALGLEDEARRIAVELMLAEVAA